jgi:tetratricopeptide (TPR) repeat protein
MGPLSATLGSLQFTPRREDAMKLRWLARLCYCLLLAIVGSDCSYASSVKCFVLQPPGQVLVGVKKIAILNFKSNYGSTYGDQYVQSTAFHDHLTQALFDKARGITAVKSGLFSKKEGMTYLSGARTDIYTLISREELDQILKEQNLGASGLVDETQAASIGKLLGADAIIVGDILSSTNDAHSMSSGKQPVPCLTRTAASTVNMRVVNVTTGAIVCTKAAQTTAKNQQCGSDISKVDSPMALIDQCLVAAADQLADAIAPRFVENKADLKDVAVKEYKDLGKKAREDAENGKLDEAYAAYASIVKDDPYNDGVMFNMGVLNEVVGNYQEAQDCYQKALGVRPNDDYSKALDRARKMNEFSPSLAQFGVSIDKHPYGVTDAKMAGATTERAKLKGAGGDRIPLYTSADQGSPVVVKVPGGIELEVVEKTGSWVKVKTFDGKVGFVRKEDVH